MNLGDPDLELIDPTPNVHSLFLHFDSLFFWAKLASRAVVRWSKRMYSCAGICSYDRGGLCDIALSEPLLKLRPRKDLIETLLHEMIHAYLFITCRDRDRDGHGPNFKAHMHRINQAAGLNISIYHDFHEEVKLYQTHWWRCNGPCQTRKPHFGIVRRSMNRPPGPSDYWWDNHKRYCGGTFVKIKEPEKTQPQKKRASPQPSGDITKYINVTNNKKNEKITKPVLKESNNVPKSNLITKSNGSNTIVVSKKNNIVFNPQVTKPVVFNGTGQAISDRSRSNSASVADTVRNVWANKQLTPTISSVTNKEKVQNVNSTKSVNLNKHKADDKPISPPAKIKKIDDYFKSTATSVLKDLYGQDFVIKEVNSNKRLSVIPVQSDLVDCPVCTRKISDTEINKHLDECLNKEVIENICKSTDTNPAIDSKNDYGKANNISNKPDVKVKNEPSYNQIKLENTPLRFSDVKAEIVDEIDLTYNRIDGNANILDKNTTSNIKNIDDKSKNSSSTTISDTKIPVIKIEPGCSTSKGHKCPCCGDVITKPIDEHFDECLAFFDNNTTIPTEGASTSCANETIVIEDDEFDETSQLNATGTKSPCPCCLKMVEFADMNEHLDICLS